MGLTFDSSRIKKIEFKGTLSLTIPLSVLSGIQTGLFIHPSFFPLWNIQLNTQCNYQYVIMHQFHFQGP